MSIYEETYEDLPRINDNFTLITPTSQELRHNLSLHEYFESEFQENSARYTYANLNEEQKRIYDAVFENPTAINVIQGAPGTGKKFTLLTIAHNWPSPTHIVSYKHDLLYPFRYCSLRYTAARFFMDMLGISFVEYQNLENQLSGSMSSLRFTTAIVNILAKAKLPPLGSGLLILDQHTFLSKPLLLVTLLLCSHAKIGVILCGDKNQLQNFHNSSHMGQHSSFDIASAFTDRIHTLEKNERCSDTQYNEIIKYVSRFSSDHDVNDFIRAIITAVFTKQLFGDIKFNSVHLAGTHKELTVSAGYCTKNERCPVSLYFIKAIHESGVALSGMSKRFLDNYCLEQFLPFLPLSIGTRYYVNNISNRTIAELKDIVNCPEDNEPVRLVLEGEGGTVIQVEKATNDLIVPERHRNALLKNNEYLYNFPLYLADFMTVHKCQGCTISRPIVAYLDNTTYQGVYAVMSRCTSPKSIVTVIIEDMFSHLLSYIINFPESVDPAFTMTVNVLEARMKNYIMYKSETLLEESARYRNNKMQLSEIANQISVYLGSKCSKQRASIRDMLKRYGGGLEKKTLLPPPDTKKDQEYNTRTIVKFLKYRKVFLSATCIPPHDLGLWLMELCRVTPSLAWLLPFDVGICSRRSHKEAGLFNLFDEEARLNLFDNTDNYLALYANLKFVSATMPAVEFINKKLALISADDYATEVLHTNSNDIVKYVSKFQKKIYDLHTESGPSSVTTELLFKWLNKWVDRKRKAGLTGETPQVNLLKRGAIEEEKDENDVVVAVKRERNDTDAEV